MMGTVQFNSSCFYRYSVLDVADLRRNLGVDDLVGNTVSAYLRASVLAVPTGKQNSMAAHNPPSFILAIIRENGTPVSLSNAFCKPVRPNGDGDLVDASIEALQDYLRRTYAMFGVRNADAFYIADRTISALQEPIKLQDSGNLDELVKAVEAAVSSARQ
jgi:CRISPR system Cascade subunit CasC